MVLSMLELHDEQSEFFSPWEWMKLSTFASLRKGAESKSALQCDALWERSIHTHQTQIRPLGHFHHHPLHRAFYTFFLVSYLWKFKTTKYSCSCAEDQWFIHRKRKVFFTPKTQFFPFRLWYGPHWEGMTPWALSDRWSYFPKMWIFVFAQSQYSMYRHGPEDGMNMYLHLWLSICIFIHSPLFTSLHMWSL